MSSTQRPFPEDFLWGTATAAYQIEGAAHAEGRGDSIWDVFARLPGAVADGHNGDMACDHYRRYRQDVALMGRLNMKAYRFSTSWARCMPDGVTPNPDGIAFYSRLVDELLAAGITPWLTLYHWDLPQALEDNGGWANRDTAYRFADYAALMHSVLGDRVRIWTTLNEPWCSAFLGYAAGIHAPGRQEPRAALAAAHHLLLGHGLAAAELRRRDTEASLGITLNLTVSDPRDPGSESDRDAARRIDGQFNRIFLDPLFRGEYPADVLADVAHLGMADLVQDGDLELIATPLDLLGVNYYHGESLTKDLAGAQEQAAPETTSVPGQATRAVASPFVAADGARSVRRGLPVTGMGWEVQPEGLRRLLNRLHTEYTGPAGIPIYITENGAAYDDVPDATGFVDDQDRLGFFAAHLDAVHRAIADGVDVRGYLAWSLLDNFEWSFGYHQRFGMVRVDYCTQDRIPKASALWYSSVASGNALPAGSSPVPPPARGVVLSV
ncbi:beta-galactosidase [Pseudarthrobacter chlorophenolicus A6]|uniref:beta-glucosidase n=1 Tax=Pseudarthrobacter chlorophenolicus (strain ATCC 700700 / DSM 12829 / CIP 107037 / JCM 12360 / KCTC 9906 / NCIMB 13794 / A6) TaxID=452863 RepID=B8HA17_PSECP|nr:family 1 glycosylhydrolase [Pseudarthrobacter chlorophenolicus]ACL38401.1 beta-galactosidase [Pseudarthrobacter chlorophenolicus A6]SDQ49512.1 beta-glucosidase [Pseudarthrobacter chlorophenolicus]